MSKYKILFIFYDINNVDCDYKKPQLRIQFHQILLFKVSGQKCKINNVKDKYFENSLGSNATAENLVTYILDSNQKCRLFYEDISFYFHTVAALATNVSVTPINS